MMDTNKFLELAKQAVLKYIKENLYPDTKLTTNDIYIETMYGNRAFFSTALLDMIYYEVVLLDQNSYKINVFDLMEDQVICMDQIGE